MSFFLEFGARVRKSVCTQVKANTLQKTLKRKFEACRLCYQNSKMTQSQLELEDGFDEILTV
jgi:hypothetical protein